MAAHSSREEAADFSQEALGAVLYALSAISSDVRLGNPPRTFGIHDALYPFLKDSKLPFVRSNFTFSSQGYSRTLSAIQGNIILGGDLVRTYDGFSFSVARPEVCEELGSQRLLDQTIRAYFEGVGAQAAQRFGWR